MASRQAFFERAALGLSFGATVSALFSIAVCQSLMALALAALLLSRDRLHFPPVKLPLALFFLGTLVSLAFSIDPAAGLPQIRKFYVFLIMLLVASALRERAHLRLLLVASAVVASLSAGLALSQFLDKWREAAAQGYDFYFYYVGERITGFMSHWQTFGGEMMLVLLMISACILFAQPTRRYIFLWIAAAGLIAAAIVLGFTRNIWLGTAVGGLYLLWFWRRWVIALVPVALVLVVLLGPASIRTRVTSIFQPQGETDSNQHRVVCYRTGLRMIAAHPLVGVGPEQVGPQFDDYVPADVPRPLPEGWYGHLHNIYLQFAAERGIPTALALFWMFGKILFDFYRAGRRARGETRAGLLGASACIIAILTAGFFEYNLGDSEVITLLLAIVAAGYVLIETGQRRTLRQV